MEWNRLRSTSLNIQNQWTWHIFDRKLCAKVISANFSKDWHQLSKLHAVCFHCTFLHGGWRTRRCCLGCDSGHDWSCHRTPGLMKANKSCQAEHASRRTPESRCQKWDRFNLLSYLVFFSLRDGEEVKFLFIPMCLFFYSSTAVVFCCLNLFCFFLFLYLRWIYKWAKII